VGLFLKPYKVRAGFTYRDYGSLLDYTGTPYTTYLAVSSVYFFLVMNSLLETLEWTLKEA
jgi:hypothetical protein